MRIITKYIFKTLSIITTGGLITFGPASEHPYRVWETPLFLLCGVVGGLFGALFNSLNASINHFRRDYMAGRPLYKVFEVIGECFP